MGLQVSLRTFVVAVNIVILFRDKGNLAKGQFIENPRNQTAEYGYFVDFECRASNCDDTLKFLINGVGLAHLGLDSRDYGKSITCSDTQLVATFWMVVNNKTIQAVNYVSCNLTVIDSTGAHDISSDRAYMEVIYPNYQECEPAVDSVCATETAYHQSKNTISGAQKGIFPAFSLQMLLFSCLLLSNDI